MSSCTPDTSYFATPEFISLFLHCVSAVETPLHLFGAYVIVFHTPTAMSSVKWPMLNFHFWSALLDLSVSFLTIPYLLLPEIAGYPLGVLTMIGVGTAAQVHFYLTVVGWLCVSLIIVYSNRYYVMRGSNLTSLTKTIRWIYLILCHIVASTFMIPLTMMVPEQESALKTVFDNLPCLPSYVYEAPVFVFTLDVAFALYYIMAMFFIIVAFIAFFGFATLFKIIKQTMNSNFSKKTLSLQKKFLIALIIQTSIPVIVGLIPIAYLVLAVPQNYYNQAMNNFSFIAFSFHGFLSTTALLVLYQPYRQATLKILFPCFGKNKIFARRKSTANNTAIMTRPN